MGTTRHRGESALTRINANWRELAIIRVATIREIRLLLSSESGLIRVHLLAICCAIGKRCLTGEQSATDSYGMTNR